MAGPAASRWAVLLATGIAMGVAAAADKGPRLEITPYVTQGDEEAAYQRAADLALLGRKKEAQAAVQPLIDLGYPEALRYEITHIWDTQGRADLSKGCESHPHGWSEVSPALERLALQGDEPAIDKYIECLTRTSDTIRTDWKPRAAMWLMERGARAGNWRHLNRLFDYYMANIVGVRASGDGLLVDPSVTSDCGFRCRKPDLDKAAEVVHLMDTLPERDSAYDSLYCTSAQVLAWAFLAKKDDRNTALWARIAAERASRVAETSPPDQRPSLEGVRTTMLRVANAIEAPSKSN